LQIGKERFLAEEEHHRLEGMWMSRVTGSLRRGSRHLEGSTVLGKFMALGRRGGGEVGARQTFEVKGLSYGPPWAHYLGGYQDRLLGGPLGLPGLRYTAPDGVEHKDYGGEVLG
jgi:hypothetical protein